MKTINVPEHIDEEVIDLLSKFDEKDMHIVKQMLVGALYASKKITIDELKEFTER